LCWFWLWILVDIPHSDDGHDGSLLLYDERTHGFNDEPARFQTLLLLRVRGNRARERKEMIAAAAYAAALKSEIDKVSKDRKP